MATIHIDGRPCPARPGENLLQACLEAGADLPYFCWHPELGSVGACRQCAVRQYSGPDDRTGRIVMACMTPATDGAILSIDDAEAREFRASVVEWLMTNHPHDCPVCAEGGECHLQDMTVMTGHAVRRYRFTKRTHRNQDLGPFVNHEMNRCIACYRCVRFYRDYAGGEDLAAFATHNDVYFGRHADGALENGFSGNLVEICPTGVFTDKPFSAVYSRKWDLRGAPSVCTHCAVGCNTIVNARQDSTRRVLNRYHDAVNRYFLCDRGRFGHGFTAAPSRLRAPLARIDGRPTPVPVQDALRRFQMMAQDGPVVGIGSSRASLESNFALRALAGPARFSTGMAEPEHGLARLVADLLRASPARNPTLHDMESADAVLILGENVTVTAPRAGLALRQAVRQAAFDIADAARIPRWMDAAVRTLGAEACSPLFVATPGPTDLDPIARATYRAAPDDIARLGFAIAHGIDPTAPDVPDLPEDAARLAADIAATLRAAARPLIVAGTQYGTAALPQAAAAIAAALAAHNSAAALSLILPDCDSMGLALMDGLSLDAVRALARDGGIGTLVVMENDLTRRLDPAALDALLAAVPHLVVIDHTATPLSARADLVLPSASFAECGGTLVSTEGRAQRFLQVLFPDPPLQAGWRWARDLAQAADPGTAPVWQDLDDIVAAIAAEIPSLAPIGRAAPDAAYRLDGARLRSEPPRISGRTAVRANISVRDRPPPAAPDTPLAPTMEGAYGPAIPGALVPYYQAPGWNSVQSLNRFQQEIGGPMRGGDAGVRLLDGARQDETPRPRSAYATAIPAPFVPRAGEILLLPEPRLFGTEELSTLSPPIAARVEAAALRIADDGGATPTIALRLNGQRVVLPVIRDPALPPGIALCPPHMALRAFAAPAWAIVQPHGDDTP
ncbi:NADH-quinone oxidoreductase subunit G [Gluconacetobacter johannae DSM 13595]|uniref:NADH-quinone oxidoreductase subunit G n=1 Tax=Gluconacetobacter johannae TaxID=112140 RepID=A0A7W4J8V4_9PROT|nr:NADH-quinone oxidoreductase subunit NuoG [Gluconacetobacter johannae]MBB2176840.1 NADH-quinone oxidoreductase subunit NuoG [Gluconacetobacter johannae]GBQ86483.1 NADH-quinone oxidoreductase subunit G [Gluconacetobacter johannae DSM 13595]